MNERKNFRKAGEEHPSAKLTEDLVHQIRQEASEPGTSNEWLARKYGVSSSTIQAVVSRQTWKEVE